MKSLFKTGDLVVKGGLTPLKMAKNYGGGMTFDELCWAYHPPSGAETSAAWSSAALLPRRPAHVEIGGGKAVKWRCEAHDQWGEERGER